MGYRQGGGLVWRLEHVHVGTGTGTGFQKCGLDKPQPSLWHRSHPTCACRRLPLMKQSPWQLMLERMQRCRRMLMKTELLQLQLPPWAHLPTLRLMRETRQRHSQSLLSR